MQIIWYGRDTAVQNKGKKLYNIQQKLINKHSCIKFIQQTAIYCVKLLTTSCHAMHTSSGSSTSTAARRNNSDNQNSKA